MSKAGDRVKTDSEEVLSIALRRMEDSYFNITGVKMLNYYRPPQGVFSLEQLKHVSSLGYKTIFWSLAYVDWYKKTCGVEPKNTRITDSRTKKVVYQN